MLYVYGTTQQIEQIKATIIDPIESYVTTKITGVKEHVIEIKNAKVDEVATTLTNYFAQRKKNLVDSGNTTLPPAELAVAIVADPVSKRLFISASERLISPSTQR